MEGVSNSDSKEKGVLVGPILHILYTSEDEIKDPVSISVPIASQQDQINLSEIPSSNVKIFLRGGKEKSRNWVETTKELKVPPRLDNGVVTFQVNGIKSFQINHFLE